MRASKAELHTLLEKYVIIKHNTYWAAIEHDGRYRYHPRFGHVGYVIAIVGFSKVRVVFDDGDCETFPIERVFYLREIDDIFIDIFGNEFALIRRHGEKNVLMLRAIYHAAENRHDKVALRMAYKSIYVYRFLTTLNLPRRFLGPVQMIGEMGYDDDGMFRIKAYR
ncbi:hypothetical protein [Chitinophaga pinensis]|uniref:Uncharacterized protein n=1 Tax=Chitinophaga pinensis (strain ATCC 43595 / DSM 2588 / LMG 13176 / NBRC 15968 / NCIMB 11800 / UQM 2034) TaxID=485918 RepID=A0A979GAR3_CHIPD|nr:hypothetical protein [Chitinophaga pinensis]ACU63745.1 hypothetical protein Cpin_6340 [Chitinophaga pinensis DSM 2588]